VSVGDGFSGMVRVANIIGT